MTEREVDQIRESAKRLPKEQQAELVGYLMAGWDMTQQEQGDMLTKWASNCYEAQQELEDARDDFDLTGNKPPMD